MNAMEKVAWTELLVSVVTFAVVTCLYPWLGNQATSAFALLALSALGAVFLRRRGTAVVVDERDREIAGRAARIASGTAWMTLLTVLVAATMWSSYRNEHAVSTAFLNWLIWIQFAVCFGIKGLVAVIEYRRQPHAS
jgi:cytochrome bd-type quinol oxidase subunit 2